MTVKEIAERVITVMARADIEPEITGKSVLIYDNLSWPGAHQNLEWLKRKYGKGLHGEIADMRDASALRGAVRSAEQVFHFAAQVTVATSLMDKRTDFEVSVGGTLNLLERLNGEKPVLRFKPWRPGDQLYYVSDTRKFKETTGWAPTVNVNRGVRRLYDWLAESSGLRAVGPPQWLGAMDAVFTH